jgi:hypothetical protein
MSKSEMLHETQRRLATLLRVWNHSLNFVQKVHKKSNFALTFDICLADSYFRDEPTPAVHPAPHNNGT